MISSKVDDDDDEDVAAIKEMIIASPNWLHVTQLIWGMFLFTQYVTYLSPLLVTDILVAIHRLISTYS